MSDELVDLLERPFVEQGLQALAGSELPLLVLSGDRPLTPRMERLFAELPQLLNPRLSPQDSSVTSLFDSPEDEMATPYWQIRREEVPSTQDLARDEFEDLPVVVIAATQSRGRGRSGVEWANAPRALAVSVAVRTDAADRRPFSLMAGIAAGRVMTEIGLKWPNDLELDEGKVGGILVEQTGDTAVIGLGLNLWWPSPPPGVSALHVEDPGPELHREIGAAWAAETLSLVRESEWPIDEYRGRSTTLSRDITWEPDGSGRAVDIADSGALVVDIGAERIEIQSGAVRHIRA